MSHFVGSTCKLVGDCVVSDLVWSYIDPIAAIATTTMDDKNRRVYKVQFINSEGGLIPNCSVSHSAKVTCMDWQPNGRVLAIGWADGLVSCWLCDGKIRPSSTFSNTSQHNLPITSLKWNPFGKRLISGDAGGLLCLWSADTRGTLSPNRQFRRKGSISNVVFCKMSSTSKAVDSAGVSTAVAKKLENQTPPFFFVTDKGLLVFADDLGHCTDIQQLSSQVDIMMYFEEKSRLVIVTRTMLLTQYQVTDDGRVNRLNPVKLSVASDVLEKGLKSVVWAGSGILAIASHEKMIRLFDLAAEESYNLSLSSGDGNRSDVVVNVAYNPIDRYLVAGTQQGSLFVWKYNGNIRDISNDKDVTTTSSQDWEMSFKSSVNSGILKLSWFNGQGVFSVVTETGVETFTENIIKNGFCSEVAVLQVGTHEVEICADGEHWKEDVAMMVKGISVCKSAFVVWSGKHATVYRIDVRSRRAESQGVFACNSKSLCIADSENIVEEAVFIVEEGLVKICNYAGVQKGTITSSDAEGTPEICSLNGKYLVVITSMGFIKIIDVHTPIKAKLVGSRSKFTYEGETQLTVKAISTNCDGTRIALLADHVEGSLMVRHADSRLHVFDRNKGSISVHDFGAGTSSSTVPRYPVSIHWSNNDDRLLVVETRKLRTSHSAVKAGDSNGAPDKQSEFVSGPTAEVDPDAPADDVELYTFFATTADGLLVQDSFVLHPPYGTLLGIIVPKYYFRNALNEPEQRNPKDRGNRDRVVAKLMRDFVGMGEVDDVTKVALLDFSYYLTLGQLDEAYRAVKSIDNPAIWENMAQMCVRTQRLDVAEVCLGNMGHARGAAALKESRREGNNLVSVGVLAIQLGLLDEAAKCFRDAKRFDMLNKLYQDAGLWEKALEIAGASDKIHLKSTHYQYAKHLESVGDIHNAIKNFEKSDTFRTEVPRMLYSLGRMEDLEGYVQQSDDATLLKWWGSYLESNQRYDKARRYYTKADDFLSLVRIYCFKGEFGKAAEIVQETNNRAAAYHLARQLENKNQLKEAIDYYSSSGCYNHAIRLAKANGLDSELMRFAVKSTPSLMLDCASYFEVKGELDKAVQLYHKGGDLAHALEVCFKAGDMVNTMNGSNRRNSVSREDAAKLQMAKNAFELLNSIAQDLGAATSPQTLARCAEFLVQHKQFEKAVELYIMAKRYLQAIEMCANSKVEISESMCEKLTPPATMDAGERKEILKELGKALKKQGAFALASKKFTQAGDRTRAMKCLTMSGNTEAVINFAKISKNVEIYILAANYLQQMNWRGSIDIMKSIVQFYTLAKAFEQLAGFFESCAQVEIDEYRDYEKAIGALKEALKHLNKAISVGVGNSKRINDFIALLQGRIEIIDKFVLARRYATKDPERMIEICEDLLNNEPNLEESVRVGDCMAMLVEFFHEKGQFDRANKYLQDMSARGIQPQPFVDSDVLNDLTRRFNSNSGTGRRAEQPQASTRDERSSGNSTANTSGIAARDKKPADEDDIDEDIEEEVETYESPVKDKGRGGNARRK